MSALVASILLHLSSLTTTFDTLVFTCFAHRTCNFNNREKIETYFHPTPLIIMSFYLPPSTPNFFKLTTLHAPFKVLMQLSYVDHIKHKKKNTYHKVNVAKEKNQKKKKTNNLKTTKNKH